MNHPKACDANLWRDGMKTPELRLKLATVLASILKKHANYVEDRGETPNRDLLHDAEALIQIMDEEGDKTHLPLVEQFERLRTRGN
jgi:hypothetical protein